MEMTAIGPSGSGVAAVADGRVELPPVLGVRVAVHGAVAHGRSIRRNEAECERIEKAGGIDADYQLFVRVD